MAVVLVVVVIMVVVVCRQSRYTRRYGDRNETLKNRCRRGGQRSTQCRDEGYSTAWLGVPDTVLGRDAIDWKCCRQADTEMTETYIPQTRTDDDGGCTDNGRTGARRWYSRPPRWSAGATQQQRLHRRLYIFRTRRGWRRRRFYEKRPKQLFNSGGAAQCRRRTRRRESAVHEKRRALRTRTRTNTHDARAAVVIDRGLPVRWLHWTARGILPYHRYIAQQHNVE